MIISYLLDKEDKCHSSSKKERSMTMVTFILSSVESCGDDHGISSREEGVWPSSPKEEQYDHGHLPTFLNRELWNGRCHHLLEKRMSALLVLKRRR